MSSFRTLLMTSTSSVKWRNFYDDMQIWNDLQTVCLQVPDTMPWEFDFAFKLTGNRQDTHLLMTNIYGLGLMAESHQLRFRLHDENRVKDNLFGPAPQPGIRYQVKTGWNSSGAYLAFAGKTSASSKTFPLKELFYQAPPRTNLDGQLEYFILRRSDTGEILWQAPKELLTL